MSCPAENASPAPVITTILVSSSVSRSSSASHISRCRSGLIALRFSGRFSTTKVTPSSCSTFMLVKWVVAVVTYRSKEKGLLAAQTPIRWVPVSDGMTHAFEGAVGHQGGFGDFYDEGFERVLDCGNNGRCCRDNARFTGALHAERIHRRGRRSIEGIHRWNFHRTRQKIIGETCRYRLPRAVIAHPFIERVADSVRDAAARLTVHDHGIDLRAVIVERDVTQDVYVACFNVHFHFGSVAGIGIGHMIATKCGERFQPGREAGREAVTGSAAEQTRQFGERHSPFRIAL